MASKNPYSFLVSFAEDFLIASSLQQNCARKMSLQDRNSLNASLKCLQGTKSFRDPSQKY